MNQDFSKNRLFLTIQTSQIWCIISKVFFRFGNLCLTVLYRVFLQLYPIAPPPPFATVYAVLKVGRVASPQTPADSPKVHICHVFQQQTAERTNPKYQRVYIKNVWHCAQIHAIFSPLKVLSRPILAKYVT